MWEKFDINLQEILEKSEPELKENAMMKSERSEVNISEVWQK